VNEDVDFGAIIGIIHKAGCDAPGMILAMPVATMRGMNPALRRVADGKGGELWQCTRCGVLENTPPPANAATAEGNRLEEANAKRRQAAGKLRREALRRQHAGESIPAIAKALDRDVRTISRYLKPRQDDDLS